MRRNTLKSMCMPPSPTKHTRVHARNACACLWRPWDVTARARTSVFSRRQFSFQFQEQPRTGGLNSGLAKLISDTKVLNLREKKGLIARPNRHNYHFRVSCVVVLKYPAVTPWGPLGPSSLARWPLVSLSTEFHIADHKRIRKSIVR